VLIESRPDHPNIRLPQKQKQVEKLAEESLAIPHPQASTLPECNPIRGPLLAMSFRETSTKVANSRHDSPLLHLESGRSAIIPVSHVAELTTAY
jgi:hypothetical protein